MPRPSVFVAVALCVLYATWFVGTASAQEVEAEQADAPPPDEAATAEGDGTSDAPDEADGEAEPTPARDEADVRARELYDQGDQAYAEGRYEDAIEAFRQSYELSGRALLLFNLANSHERLGNYTGAVDALHRYRETAPAEEHETLDRRIEALEARAATTPGDTPPPSPPPPDEPGGVDSTVAWIVVASGGAAAAASIVLGALALAARDDARDNCRATDDGRLCTGEAEGALGRDQGLSVAADVTAAVGLTALAVGVVLLLTGPDDGGEVAPASVSGPRLTVTARGAGLGVTW